MASSALQPRFLHQRCGAGWPWVTSSERLEPPAEPEAEAARFIDDKDAVAFGEERLHPGHEVPGGKAPRRLGRGVVLPGRHDVAGLVNVESELDRRARKATVGSGGANRRRHSAMNDVFFHTKAELNSPPAAFHAICGYCWQWEATC